MPQDFCITHQPQLPSQTSVQYTTTVHASIDCTLLYDQGSVDTDKKHFRLILGVKCPLSPMQGKHLSKVKNPTQSCVMITCITTCQHLRDHICQLAYGALHWLVDIQFGYTNRSFCHHNYGFLSSTSTLKVCAREGKDLFLLFTLPQRTSPPPTYKKTHHKFKSCFCPIMGPQEFLELLRSVKLFYLSWQRVIMWVETVLTTLLVCTINR